MILVWKRPPCLPLSVLEEVLMAELLPSILPCKFKLWAALGGFLNSVWGSKSRSSLGVHRLTLDERSNTPAHSTNL